MSKLSRRGNVRNSPQTWRQRAVVVLALALTTMPVSYRGGTDTAHPHAFLQFLVEAAAGAMKHHRIGPVDGHDAHGAQHSEAASEEASYVAAASRGQPAFDQLTPVNERTSAIAISLLVAAFAIGSGALLMASHADRLVGIVVRPQSRPPRRVLSAF